MLIQASDFASKYIRFNFDWKFRLGDVEGAHVPELDDADWRTLDLPHDWSIEGPFDRRWASGTAYLPGGIGWYRKTFRVSDSLRGSVLTVRFDGVYKNAEVWMNGRKLGIRPYGYSSFQYDLSGDLRFGGQPNVLAVKVSRPDAADSRWYPGTGIYRNVFLGLSGRVHIKPYGVYVTTPSVSAERAEVRIETSLVNSTSAPVSVRLVHTAVDGLGRTAATLEQDVEIEASAGVTAAGVLAIERPLLWHVDHPYLYRLETAVYVNGERTDREHTTFGIRTFRFDPDRGFFLNGGSLKMKGVCLHHDAGALGAAVPIKVWERRLRILKEAGVNAIRMSHNPPDPELLDLCDSMGFLVMDEAFDEWELPKNKWVEGYNQGIPSLAGYAGHFAEWAETDLRDMILRDRNHPSVVFWSIGNEIDYPNDPYSHPVLGDKYDPARPDARRLGEIAARLARIVRALDPTRPVTAALASPLMSNETAFPDALDVVGYNYMEHRYEEDHRRYPNRVIYGSENGRHLEAWLAVERNDYICAQFIWTGIDYLGEAKGWPIRSATSGLLDLAGFAKPIYHFKRSLWSDRDMVRLAVLKTEAAEERFVNWHTDVEEHWEGEPGTAVTVVCCTNCPEAELFVNGQSMGVKRLTDVPDRTLKWTVPYTPGTIKAIGLRGGEIRCVHELHTAGAASKLLVEADTRVVLANRQDIVHVEVTVLDGAGRPVTNADQEVTFEIEGPGEIIGIESGDPASHEDYKAHRRRVYHGKLLVYIRSKDIPGVIRLTASASGLEGGEVEITAKGIARSCSS